MHNKASIFIILIVIILILTGCSYRLGDLTIASTKNVNIGEKYVRISRDVVGKDTKPIIIVIPTGYPSIEEAIDAALRTKDGELMTNLVIYYKWWYIPYIYGEYVYEVKGDALAGLNKNDLAIDQYSLALENSQNESQKSLIKMKINKITN